MKVLIDTNMFLTPGKFKVDIFSELERFGKPEIYTLDLVIKELEQIAAGKSKDAKAAKLGLLLIEKKKVKILKTEGKNADKEIEKIAQENYSVCTQDKLLIEKLKKKNIKVFSLRQKRYLVEV